MSALGSYIHMLAKLLENSGYEVFLNGEKSKNFILQNISKVAGKSLLKRIIPIFFKRIVKDIVLLNKTDTFAKNIKGEYDLILEFYSYGSTAGYITSKKQNIPLTIVYDAPLIDEYMHFNKAKPFLKKKIEKRQNKTLNLATAVVVYSNPVKEYLADKYSIKSNFFIHQNIDFSRFKLTKEKEIGSIINICFIGSFLKWHRVDLLIDTFIMLRDNNIDACLYLIGGGMEFDVIKNKALNCPYNVDIKLPGFIDGKELEEYKNKMHIGVMPSSNWYGAPNKIFEYGAANMAVVAPNTPTITDIFKEQQICLFENNSKRELYKKLFTLCSNKKLMNEKKEKLFNFVKINYSEEITSLFYKKILNQSLLK